MTLSHYEHIKAEFFAFVNVWEEKLQYLNQRRLSKTDNPLMFIFKLCLLKQQFVANINQADAHGEKDQYVAILSSPFNNGLCVISPVIIAVTYQSLTFSCKHIVRFAHEAFQLADHIIRQWILLRTRQNLLHFLPGLVIQIRATQRFPLTEQIAVS